MAGRTADLRGWTTTSDGARLAHQVRGPYDAPTVLLLPGQANSHAWWDVPRRKLSEDFLIITFDYRGTGQTQAAVGRDWSTASFADDAAAVLRALGRSEVFVYGTSMGGRVAQELALRHPRLVSKLVLACTSPGGPHAQERSVDVRRALADSDADRRREALVDLFYTPAWVASRGGRAEVPTHLFGDPGMTPAAARAHLDVSDRHNAWDRLPQISAPTLVLHGDDDQMVPGVNGELLASRIPEARLEVTSGGRHGFFDEFNNVVTAGVAAFFGAPAGGPTV